MAALAYPALSAYIADARLQAGADHLRAQFATARAYAIDQNQPYLFAVKPGESGYRLAPDTSDPSGGANMGSSSDSNPDAVTVEDVLPHEIRFGLDAGASNGQSVNGYTGILTFMPDG